MTPAQQDARTESMSPEQAKAVLEGTSSPASADAGQAAPRRIQHDRQLEEVMVDFWFNHFNVFSRKGQVRVYLNDAARCHPATRPWVVP